MRAKVLVEHLIITLFTIVATIILLTSTLPSTYKVVLISVPITISLLSAHLCFKMMLKPIMKLASEIKKLSLEDLNLELHESHDRMLNELSFVINNFLEDVKYKLGSILEENSELKNVISSLEDGILILDKNGKVLLTNDKMKEYLRFDQTNGKLYWEVVADINIGEAIDEVIKTGAPKTLETTIKGRTLLCRIVPITSKGEIVLILHDISSTKDVEKLKRDLVANVSHELRTPLTSIKGFADTLSEIVDEEGKHYLDIIIRNTERLINIVNDLLDLSELENSKALDLEEVDVRIIINDVAKLFEQNIKEKGLSFKVIVDPQLPLIMADAFKLEQAFMNIVDNAIKYTESGGITVSIYKEQDNVVVSVEDTGIGIPQKDLNRIFERFYVVDKSRSRKKGGTGLGLSIVKHIVDMHNGHIDVKSTYGVGTKFSVTLPIKQPQNVSI